METALTTMRRELEPDLATWENPTGGYLIWLPLPWTPHTRTDALDLEAELRAFGVEVRAGERFFSDPTQAKPKPSLRLSISHLNETEIRALPAWALASELSSAKGALHHDGMRTVL